MSKSKSSKNFNEKVFEDIESICKEKGFEQLKDDIAFLYLAALEGNREIIAEISNKKGEPADLLTMVIIATKLLTNNNYKNEASFLFKASGVNSQSGDYKTILYNIVNNHFLYQKKRNKSPSFTIDLNSINMLLENIAFDKTSIQSQKLIIDAIKIFSLFFSSSLSISLVQDYFCILTGRYVASYEINNIINELYSLNIPLLSTYLISNLYQCRNLPEHETILKNFSNRYPNDNNKSKALTLYYAILNNHWNVFHFFTSPEYSYILSFVIETMYLYDNQNFRISLLQHLQDFSSQEIISDAYEHLFSINHSNEASNLLNDYVDYYIYYQTKSLELTFLNLVAFFGPRMDENAIRMLSWQLRISNYQDSSHTQNLVFLAYETIDRINSEQSTSFIAFYTGSLLLNNDYSKETDITLLLCTLEEQEQDILVDLITNYFANTITEDNSSEVSTIIDQTEFLAPWSVDLITDNFANIITEDNSSEVSTIIDQTGLSAAGSLEETKSFYIG